MKENVLNHDYNQNNYFKLILLKVQPPLPLYLKNGEKMNVLIYAFRI